jgi:hypothetical protein
MKSGIWAGLALAFVATAATAQDYVAPDGRTLEQLIADHVLPDPQATPGVLNPKVTAGTIKITVCVARWTATVRPPTSYTDPIKQNDVPTGEAISAGELDHLISIEDGGDPSDPMNLWWQKYDDLYGARVKDVLETRVKRLLCSGKITLDEARAALSPNWLVGYVRYVGPLPTIKK